MKKIRRLFFLLLATALILTMINTVCNLGIDYYTLAISKNRAAETDLGFVLYKRRASLVEAIKTIRLMWQGVVVFAFIRMVYQLFVPQKKDEQK